VKIASLDEVDVRGKTVLLRVDINSPIDRATGNIADVLFSLFTFAAWQYLPLCRR